MFTGIVEGLGRVAALEPQAAGPTPAGPAGGGTRLTVEAAWLDGRLAVGGSVAVNGCCVTATEVMDGQFGADLVAETLRRTTLGRLAAGDPVNLELPLRADGRLGGHLVQGHVDGVGRVLARRPVPGGEEVSVALAPALARYVVEKGSIAVDGVSLTVTAAGPDHFALALVPHTLAVTTLGRRQVGDAVNLEVDILAKYVERLLAPYAQEVRS
jgi:riboflavin synthase